MNMIRVPFVTTTHDPNTKEPIMLAATQTTYGAPNVLIVEQVEPPTCGPTDVLIQVHAAAVTHGDRRLRASDFPALSWLPGRLMFGLFSPRTPVKGTQFAGRVVAVGEQVTRYSVGDDVFGGSGDGAYAEVMVLPEGATMARIPTGWGYTEAASMTYGGITALQFFRDMAGLQPGEHVAVIGASGGVGRQAVQIARALGAEVTAISSRDEDLLRSLGADHVVDRRTEDFTTHTGRYDIVFDTSGVYSFTQTRSALTPTGRFVSVYMTARGLWEMAWNGARGGQRSICGVALGAQEHVEQLADWMAEGALRAVIEQIYPLEQIVAAHERLERGALSGDIIVECSPAHVTRLGTTRAA